MLLLLLLILLSFSHQESIQTLGNFLDLSLILHKAYTRLLRDVHYLIFHYLITGKRKQLGPEKAPGSLMQGIQNLVSGRDGLLG